MVNDADRFKNEDEIQKERIGAKNSLESYIFSLKTTLDQDQVKAKLSDSDMSEAKEALDSALKWLDMNQLGEKEEYTEKQKELETGLKTLLGKLHSQDGAQDQSCGKQANQGHKEPTIEEVD